MIEVISASMAETKEYEDRFAPPLIYSLLKTLKICARHRCILISVGSDGGRMFILVAVMSTSLQLDGKGTVERWDCSNGGRPRQRDWKL